MISCLLQVEPSKKWPTIAVRIMVMALSVIHLFVPTLARADPLGREGIIPVSKESYFYLDNATLYEPYASLDSSLTPLELSHLLNEESGFPTMHFITEGNHRVIGARVLAMARTREELHSTWSEDLTLLLPTDLQEGSKTKTYPASQIVGIYATFGKEAWRSSMAFVASGGAVTIAVLDEDRLKVDVDLILKRVDINPIIYENGSNNNGAEYVNRPKDGSIDFASINLKKSFVVRRKQYRDLSFWEGRAGSMDVNSISQYRYCTRCYFDKETSGSLLDRR